MPPCVVEDMESIDALAKAVNMFEGGLVLVSHDMRLISQVAKEIWICDNKTVTVYKGDIQNFKMQMRAQMGLSDTNSSLKGDASVKKKEGDKKKESAPKAPPKPGLEVLPPLGKEEKPAPKPPVVAPSAPKPPVAAANGSGGGSLADAFDMDDVKEQVPAPKPTPKPKPTPAPAPASSAAPRKYIPPHIRRKMMQEQQQQQK